jgi:type III pantothenate kinase
MNLIIDQGNSVAKLALFEKNTLVDCFQTEVLTTQMIEDLLRQYAVSAGIVSSVGRMNKLVYHLLKNRLSAFCELNIKMPMPLQIDYKTPETLGVDRIAAAVGAWIQQPNSNILVIDMGTAITIDFVSQSGIYKGGNISPGMDLRFKALNHFTDKLPLVNETGEIPALGYDTETAIRSGVIEGIVREIDSYIEEYKKEQPVFIFLTGGYAFYFENRLKNTIFADGNLVLKGLNEILNYQYV